MSIEHRESWKCKVCREVDNTKSVTTQGSDIAHDIGTRSRSKLNTPEREFSQLGPKYIFCCPAIELLSEMRLLREEVKAARADMLEFRSTISGLSTAVNLCNQRVDDLSERVEAIEHTGRIENVGTQLRALLSNIHMPLDSPIAGTSAATSAAKDGRSAA
ncbi:hypothetical protein MSG28_009514 [Choristoneura fumiferana]|uniref:Uncharacterized protein n=1 Tax=Choristoneura fumiferana TaxID=7141 RepID=A0ACC0JBG4_CHOFU|nr:hypothetical protein MSG28_009514 [Choristoneura fumiferana]